MSTIALKPITTVRVSPEEFMRLRKEGKLGDFHVRGIQAPTLGSRNFGSIVLDRKVPIYEMR